MMIFWMMTAQDQTDASTRSTMTACTIGEARVNSAMSEKSTGVPAAICSMGRCLSLPGTRSVACG